MPAAGGHVYSWARHACLRVHSGAPARHGRIYKATYAANAPNEDKMTVAADLEAGHILAGVWDGHAGDHCSQFIDAHVIKIAKTELERGHEGGRHHSYRGAMARTLPAIDSAYTQFAEGSAGTPQKMCCGSCACMAFVELGQEESTIVVGNLGDSRAVAASFDGGRVHAHVLSSDHAVATSPSERARLRSEFPALPQVSAVLLAAGQLSAWIFTLSTLPFYLSVRPSVYLWFSCLSHCLSTCAPLRQIVTQRGDEVGDSTVMGMCRFTRAIGDCHMKSKPSCEVGYTAATCPGSLVRPADDI